MQDPGVLARAIPGCESLEKIGDDEYSMKMKMVLASLSGNFTGKVKISEQAPPGSFRLTVEGNGKVGFVKGSGVLTLTPAEAGTDVAYDGDAQIGGTMAAVGQRLIDGTAKMMIKKFFEKLGRQGAAEETTGEAAPEAALEASSEATDAN
jgi:uncharacterized protein